MATPPRSPPPQFRHGIGGEGNILHPLTLVGSAATAHKTLGPIDLTSTYSVCTRRVFGGIGHRTQAFFSEVQNALTTRLPKALIETKGRKSSMTAQVEQKPCELNCSETL
ncbi:hypothetical protein TNCV_4431151 [Trichonephila clavipes]|nr:hypothetical protein TNCV_4431151 [Trichonephila clavipes]